MDHTKATSINVLIVGCGFSGLACAIECKQKGHSVIVLEKRPDLDDGSGDVISFASNVGRFFEKWGLQQRLLDICTQHPILQIQNHLGQQLAMQTLPQKIFGHNSFNGRRGEIYKIIYNYALEMDVDIRFGQNVTDYWEDKESAGVTSNGVRIVGDVVVGADGIRSKARKLVLGQNDQLESSGYSIYRAWFNAHENGSDKNPLTSIMCTSDAFLSWLGNDAHMLAMSFHKGKEICWLFTYKDKSGSNDPSSNPGNKDDVLALVQDWDPRCRALIKQAPSCTNWKLLYRDPLPTWVSEHGRIVLIGDAAHPILPTSIQGGAQGIEDGVTLAITLQLAGKEKIPLALKTYERIRYDRVSLVQKMGEMTRDKWHKSGSMTQEEPQKIQVELPFPEWLLNFDAEEYAYRVYEDVSKECL